MGEGWPETLTRRARDRALLPRNADRRVLRLGRGRPAHLPHAGRPRLGARARAPGPRKKIWVNVPVVEPFAAKSPFRARQGPAGYHVRRRRAHGDDYPVEIPPEPAWYSRTDHDRRRDEPHRRPAGQLPRHLRLQRVPLLEPPSRRAACEFCTTGRNVGVAEQARKKVEDVVEVARAARDESGSIFTHFNTGYHFEDVDRLEPIHGLRQCEPFVKAVRREVGGFIGVQAMPVPRRKFARVRRADRGGGGPLLLLLRVRGSRDVRAALPGQGRRRSGSRRSSRRWSTRRRSSAAGRVSGRDHRGARADRRDEARDRPNRRTPARSRRSASSGPRSEAR